MDPDKQAGTDSGQREITTIKAELRDISSGGALIYCQDQLELDESLQIVIKAPDGKSLAITIAVVWSDYNDENKPYGFGARFIKISEEDRRLLLEVISQLRDITVDPHKK